MAISQREARRLKKRVEALEQRERVRNRAWASEYPGGVNIDTIEVKSVEWHIVTTARRLGHACVVVPDKEGWLRVYGISTEAK
jgi:ribonucleotide reductase alpha subunit